MTDYLTTDTELTSIANAIRTKGGTSAQLEYPSGFVAAIGDIQTGGGGSVETTTISISQSQVVVTNIYWVDDTDTLRSDYETVVGDFDVYAVVNPVIGSRMVIAASTSIPDLSKMTSEASFSVGSRPTKYVKIFKVTG